MVTMEDPTASPTTVHNPSEFLVRDSVAPTFVAEAVMVEAAKGDLAAEMVKLEPAFSWAPPGVYPVRVTTNGARLATP
jgi:hypothetical protein